MSVDPAPQMEIMSQAPTRISFAGGGTDVSPYPETYGGEVINATISIYMLARLRLRDDSKVVIETNTRPKPMVYPDVTDLEFDGRLDFVKAIVRDIYDGDRGFDLYFHSSLPMRSGLGGSGAMCLAILGALNHVRGSRRLTPYQLAETAFRIETEVLGNASGRQDQYAAAFGGMNHFEFIGSEYVRVNPVNIPPAGLHTLNHALLLFWLGDRDPSGAIIEEQANGVLKGGRPLEAMHRTKETIPEVMEALEAVDVRAIGELLHRLWQEKKSFSRNISNGRIDEVYERLQKAGMIGGKVTGAGGGGHLLACCELHRRDALLAEAESLGIRSVPFSFVREGVLTWESPVRMVTNGHSGSAASAYLPVERVSRPYQ